MAARSAITTPDLVVLSLLAERPFHGYELNRELEWREVRDWAGISRPQVYYSLAKLAGRKLIRGVEGDEGTGPDRETYRITAAGLAALRKALEDPEWAEQRPPPPFLTWMALSGHAEPAVVVAQLERRRKFLEQELAKERKTLAEFEGSGYAVRAARQMVTLAIRQFEVELEWLESAKLELQYARGSSG